MRYESALIFAFLLACFPAYGQQNAQAIHPADATITAPVLIPPTLTVSTPKHCDQLDGVVKFAAMIDAAGLPHALKMLDTSDRRLVGFAMELAEAQRFKPGTIDGSTATMAVELTVGLHTCAQREKHPADENFYQFTLRAHPMIALAVAAPVATQEVPATAQMAAVEQIGSLISTPTPIRITDPQIPVSRKLPKRGHCFISVTVDANGIPQNVRVAHGLDPELDSYAVDAAKNWRFKPALGNGDVPVAVEGMIAATFEYVEREPVAFAVFISDIPEKVLAKNSHRDEQQIDLAPLNEDEVMARYKPSNRIAGLSLVAMVVDSNGVPQNVRVVRGVDSSLDTETVAMVEHLRFKPVLKDGTTPVSVGVIVPVQYRVNTWKNVLYSIANVSILLFT